MLCDPTQRYIVIVLVRILSRHPTLQFMMAACAAFLKSGPGHVLQPVTVAGGARRGGGGRKDWDGRVLLCFSALKRADRLRDAHFAIICFRYQ